MKFQPLTLKMRTKFQVGDIVTIIGGTGIRFMVMGHEFNTTIRAFCRTKTWKWHYIDEKDLELWNPETTTLGAYAN